MPKISMRCRAGHTGQVRELDSAHIVYHGMKRVQVPDNTQFGYTASRESLAE